MNYWKRLLVILLALVAGMLIVAASCEGDDDDDDDNDDDDSAPQTHSFTTYNTGLAHGYVDLADERLPVLLETLPQADFDVLCLQEVWSDEDINAVLNAASTAFSGSLRYDTTGDFEGDDDDDDEPPCDDLSELQTCAENNECVDDDGYVDIECAFAFCLDEINALAPDCFNCLASNIDKPLTEIIETCTTTGGNNLAYGASNGLILLSNLELSGTDHLQLDFFFTVRIVLYAKALTDAGPVHLFCTHLTADISATVEYTGDYGSYEEEQALQIDALLAYIEQKAGDEPAVLLGDLNTGPATETLDGEFPDNYDLLVDGGLVDPYLEKLPDTCTWCASNDLTGGDKSSIIDHVLFWNFPADAAYAPARIYDDPITVTVDEQEQETYLSDHFGATVEATW